MTEPVAIIGMSCLFPKAPDLDVFWQNILDEVDAVSDPPPESWDPELYYDPASGEPDRIYCKRGGFLGELARFDPVANNVPPSAVGGEPDQWLALQLARDALRDAGYSHLDPGIRHRTAVILGRGATFSGGTAISVQHSLVVTQTIQILRQLHPDLEETDLEALRSGLRSSLPEMSSEIVPGLVPNIVAGRIANRLDLMGPSYTIDAACASSLVAVNNGVRDLAAGTCDLVLAGGVQVWTPMPMLSVFCRLNALSRRQQIRPFDKDADGTILGEGLGMIVLKRLADAERDEDRIYAVIKGVAVASDGKALGVMAPRLEGQELVLRRAYDAAGVDPDSVELIEAHGTGTLLGDLTEVKALTRVFGQRQGRLPSVALGTVKSMISHTVPAAGVAGIIKAALGLHFKVLPPTLNCDAPNPKFELDKTPFYISTRTRPWISGREHPRRAGVSAFGFGGIDSHVVLEEYMPEEDRILARAATAPREEAHRQVWDSEVFVFQGSTRSDVISGMAALRDYLSALPEPSPVSLQDIAFTLAQRSDGAPLGAVRLAVVASSFEDLQVKVNRALEKISDPVCKRVQDRSGIYFYSERLAEAGKIAFLFPGEGSQYPGMLADLCLQFPEVRRSFDALDQMYREAGRPYVPSDFIFPRPTFSSEEKEWVQRQLWDMDVAPAAVLAANEALLKLLDGLGVEPDVVVGHSSGEWSALRAAKVFGASDAERERWIGAELLDVYRDSIAHDDIPQASLLAIGGGEEQVAEILAEAGGGGQIAMDNCPHQVVVAADPSSAPRIAEAARRKGLVVETLEFDRPYHTAGFAPYSRRLLAALAPLEFRQPAKPAISNATGGLFPHDAAEMKRLCSEQWVRQVRFRQTIERLYGEHGVRLFIEVGPRGNLSAFVEDILRRRPACIAPANTLRRSGTLQLNHLVGMLFAQGLSLKLQYLFRWRSPRRVDLAAVPPKPAAGVLLSTQFPEMRIPDEIGKRLLTEVDSSRADEREAPAREPAGNGKVQPALGAARTEGTGYQPSPRGALADAGAAHRFLETMEHFLQVQESVMTAYLTGGGPSGSVAPDALPAPLRQPQPGVGPPGSNGRDTLPPSGLGFPPDTPMEDPVVPETQTVPPEPFPEQPADPQPPEPIADFEIALREIVSERTGYPIETIALTADLEADLGIDSIKRVEIMGTFRQRLPGDSGIDIEGLTSRRTLQEVIAFVRDRR